MIPQHISCCKETAPAIKLRAVADNRLTAHTSTLVAKCADVTGWWEQPWAWEIQPGTGHSSLLSGKMVVSIELSVWLGEEAAWADEASVRVASLPNRNGWSGSGLKKNNWLILGCTGSSLLLEGFLWLRRAGATVGCNVQASHCGGFSWCGARLQVHRLQWLQHVGFSSCGAQA